MFVKKEYSFSHKNLIRTFSYDLKYSHLDGSNSTWNFLELFVF